MTDEDLLSELLGVEHRSWTSPCSTGADFYGSIMTYGGVPVLAHGLIVTHDPSVSEHVRRTVQMRDGRCSTEVLRRTETNEHGHEDEIAEEFAVIDKVGRMQLPQEFMSTLGLRDRVRLGLETDHVRVSPSAPSSNTGDDDRERN